MLKKHSLSQDALSKYVYTTLGLEPHQTMQLVVARITMATFLLSGIQIALASSSEHDKPLKRFQDLATASLIVNPNLVEHNKKHQGLIDGAYLQAKKAHIWGNTLLLDETIKQEIKQATLFFMKQCYPQFTFDITETVFEQTYQLLHTPHEQLPTSLKYPPRRTRPS